VRVFLPQSTLETWALDDQADVRDGQLVLTGDPRGYPVTPAVHFLQVVSGADDRRLVERVKTAAQLADLGAEHLHDSVLIGEDAYEVVPGYVAELPSTQRTANPEADLLAAFILNKL
jgi:hypothetical protein